MPICPKPARGIFLGLLLLFCSPLATPAAAGPQAQISQTTYDFGEVFEDVKLTHTFAIKNVGDAPLKIEDLDSDCACTTTESDRLIPPGGEGRVTLTIAPYSVLRQFTKRTTVFLNDPQHPQLVLTLKGYGKPFIEIQPSHIVRLRGTPEEDLRGQVRFISHLPEPWEITAAHTNIPNDIEVRVIPKEPGRVYVVEVRNKRREAGHYAGVIRLSTTSAKRPRLIMRVFGDITIPSSESP